MSQTRAGSRRAPVLTGIGLGLFGLTAVAFLRPPLLPEMGREMDLSATGLGALLSIFALGRLAADIPAGHAVDRRTAGPLMAASGFLVAVGTLLMSMAPGTVILFGGAFVLGLGSTLVITTATAAFATTTRANRGMSLSLFAGAMLAGQAVGPAIGGALGVTFDWRGTLLVGGALAAALAIPFLFVRRPVPLSHTPDRPASVAPDQVPRRVLAVIYLLPVAQFSIGAALIQTLIPVVGDGELGFGPGTVGLAIGIGGVIRFGAAIASGHISDRISRRAALIPGLGLQTAGVVAFGFGSAAFWWWMAIILLTLGSVAVNVGNTILADLSEGGDRLGRRLGAFRFTGDAAFLVTPVVIGAIFERYGRAISSVPLVTLAVLVTVAAMIVIPETRHAAGVGRLPPDDRGTSNTIGT